MPSTYEIIEAQAHLQAMVEALLYAEDDAERDAIQAEIDTWLEALGDAEPEKLDALRHVHRRLSTLEEEARAEARRLGERARSIASQAERVKGLAAVILDGRRRRGAEAKVTTATATYRLQLGPASVVGPEDVARWQDEGWARIKIEPDKRAALAALKGAQPEQWPDGWSLEQSESVRW